MFAFPRGGGGVLVLLEKFPFVREADPVDVLVLNEELLFPFPLLLPPDVFRLVFAFVFE